MKPIRARSARLLALAAALFALAAPSAHASVARALGASADSASRATWTLKNGTRVLLQHVPEAQVISISVAYPGGSDQDPAALPGLAQLLAELQFTAAAGEVPARTREELSSLRPAGADLHVGRQFTVLTEVATAPQFPGVLHQVIARLRGTQPDATTLARALETVSLIVRHNFRDDPSAALYNQITERASGVDDAGMARLLAMDGLHRMTLADATARLAAAFRPQNAVISIAGNLAGFDMHTLLEHALEGVPGGKPPALPPIRRQRGALAAVKWPGLDHPAGGLGVFAPSLEDSTHPTFFLVSMILGAKTSEQWGVPQPPLQSQFQFSVVEDPDIVRFYPPLAAGQNSPNVVGLAFSHTLGDADNLVVSDELIAKIRDGVGWLLGAPLTDQQLDRMRVNPTTVILCSEQMAERELRGGEEFWRRYRQRLEEAGAPDLVYWLALFRNPSNQAGVVLTP